jgi:hypothetical protein
MKWNYRLLAHVDGDDYFFQIHEVYYNKKGKPISFTKKGVIPSGSTVNEVLVSLDEMSMCAKKPILSAERFPEIWDPLRKDCLLKNVVYEDIIKELKDVKTQSLRGKRTADYRIGLNKAIDIVQQLRIENLKL